jgi:hypothetical protein
MKRDKIIQAVIDALKAQTYLEIGVQRGKNFFAINAPFKVAVDPNFMIGITRRLKNLGQVFKHAFIEKTSNDFFDQDAERVFAKGLDVSFIDGLHTYEQSLLDFENSLKHLNPNGVILFHDCNPLNEGAGVHADSPKDARDKFSEEIMEWNGDVWKTIAHIRSLHNDLNVFVLDTDHGVGVVYRGTPEKMLSFTREQINALSYEYFDKNRKELLNLKPTTYLDEFLKKIAKR